MEIWKRILKHPFYAISTRGRVISHKGLTPKLMKNKTAGGGTKRGTYPSIKIDGKMCYIHTLVLEAFVGHRPEGMQACHNDGNPLNNWHTNLRWDTQKNNNLDKAKHGTNFKLTNEDFDEMFSLTHVGASVNHVARLFNTGRQWTLLARNRAKRGDYVLPVYARKDHRASKEVNYV